MCRRKDFTSAISLLKSATKDYPDHEILNGLLASCYQELGMMELASESYRRVIAANAENFLAIHQLGLIEFNQQKWGSALSIWRTLLQRSDDFLTKYYAAICCLELGRKQDSLEFAKLATELTPPEHPIYSEVLKFKELLDE